MTHWGEWGRGAEAGGWASTEALERRPCFVAFASSPGVNPSTVAKSKLACAVLEHGDGRRLCEQELPPLLDLQVCVFTVKHSAWHTVGQDGAPVI